MSTAAERSESERAPVARAAWASKASSFDRIDLNHEMKDSSPAGKQGKALRVFFRKLCKAVKRRTEWCVSQRRRTLIWAIPRWRLSRVRRPFLSCCVCRVRCVKIRATFLRDQRANASPRSLSQIRRIHPPEVLGQSIFHAAAADVWALAVLLFEIIHRYLPFESFDAIQHGYLRMGPTLSTDRAERRSLMSDRRRLEESQEMRRDSGAAGKLTTVFTCTSEHQQTAKQRLCSHARILNPRTPAAPSVIDRSKHKEPREILHNAAVCRN
ncbi:hypothetical protein G5714_019286 [Onychostoma macrolepis]|uniref:Protein kinase domain-containing protein n=1 Tax=Onychostoma macrolepis TaxID=369639 RepID=A0A7J6BW10_9TELE|nr:hypothetical protein G5714_019286 [Onychostoma macrolepis]